VADELGGDAGAVRMAVWRLRKVLAERVESGPAGYRLVLATGDWLDAAAFEDLLASARSATTPTQRADRLRDALRLWRGPAFTGLEDVASVQPGDVTSDVLARGPRLEDGLDGLALREHVGSAVHRCEPVPILARHAEAGVRHTEWVEQARSEEVGERLVGEHLDQFRRHVDPGPVMPTIAGVEREWKRGQRVDHVAQRPCRIAVDAGLLVARGDRGVLQLVGHPTGMGEQVSDLDRADGVFESAGARR
jgi:hypothetical protein